MNEGTSSKAVNHGQANRRGWLSFWSLLTLQTQNAFNDKAAQFLLIPIGAWLVSMGADMAGTDQIEYILATIIVLPFILFSPLSGWFSDRFSKTIVVRAASVLQLVILIWITVSIYFHQLWPAVFGFFVLAIQSVLLGPAKRGLVKELIGHEKLGMASGLIEIFSILAICAGQIVTGVWFSSRRNEGYDGWDAALFPMIILTGASVAALFVSFMIQKMPAQSQRKFSPKILFEHFGQLGDLLKERSLRLSAVGVAFFWGYASYLNLAAIGMAKDLIVGDNDSNFAFDSAMLMAAASLGIIMGGAIASFICRRGIELGLIPIGGLLMVVGSLTIAVTPGESEWLKLWFVIAGAGGALLLVPLNSNIQDLCPPEKRGKILAGVGLLDCLAALVAVIIQLSLDALDVPFSAQFVGLAIVCIFATRYSAKLLPQHVMRLGVLAFVKLFYRVRAMNTERIPSEGGVLMVSNHVSYVDAFILSAASPRKIRFLMFDAYFKRRWIGKFVKLFDTVPISKTRAKEALKVAAEALEEGHLVCIFPEGQLSRTGCMNEFKRGFEMIAKKAKCPVLPAAMDGLWGSIFSFERDQFIHKKPYNLRYGMTVNFGELIPPSEIKASVVRDAVSGLRADAFAQRRMVRKPLSIINKNVDVYTDDISLLEEYETRVNELQSESLSVQQGIIANALQVADVNALTRKQTVMIEWDGLQSCRDVVAIALAQYLKLKVVLVKSNVQKNDVLALTALHEVDRYLGGKALAQACADAGIERACFDFSEDAISRDDSLACLAHEGRVVSMSMPHPDAVTATNQHQEGYRDGAWGRLLPGYKVVSNKRSISLSGVSIGPDKVVEIEGLKAELQGFIEQL